MNNCKWEDGKFKGTSEKGLYYELEASNVAKAEDLRLKLSYEKKDVEFKMEKVAGGFYSSLWTWNIEGENKGEKPAYPKTCVHEWVNQGFQHIVMACKFCGASAPSWVKKP